MKKLREHRIGDLVVVESPGSGLGSAPGALVRHCVDKEAVGIIVGRHKVFGAEFATFVVLWSESEFFRLEDMVEEIKKKYGRNGDDGHIADLFRQGPK